MLKQAIAGALASALMVGPAFASSYVCYPKKAGITVHPKYRHVAPAHRHYRPLHRYGVRYHKYGVRYIVPPSPGIVGGVVGGVGQVVGGVASGVGSVVGGVVGGVGSVLGGVGGALFGTQGVYDAGNGCVYIWQWGGYQLQC